MIDLFATTVEKPEVRLMPSFIWGGAAGLSFAIFEIVVLHTRTPWFDGLVGLTIALCPAGAFFWWAQVDASAGVLWFTTIVVCVTNFLLWAGFVCTISAAVQKLLHLSHRRS